VVVVGLIFNGVRAATVAVGLDLSVTNWNTR
jgi:hypothetical protein